VCVCVCVCVFVCVLARVGWVGGWVFTTKTPDWNDLKLATVIVLDTACVSAY